MRVLLTGGSGFVGGHVARALHASGHELRLLVRPTSDTSFVDAEPAVPYHRSIGDLTDPDSLHAACEDMDVIIHAAAVLRAVRQSAFMRANADGTRNLADAAARAGVSRFVYISSIAAQGPAPTYEPEPPETPLHPVSPYGRSKAAGEVALTDTDRCMPVTIVRPPMVYGPADTGLQIFFWLARRGISARLGDGSSLVDAIYGPDLAEAVVATLAGPDQGIVRYHATGPGGPHNWNELLASLERVAGRRLWIPSLSPSVFHAFARISETWASLRGIEPTLDRARVIELRQRAWLCDSSSLTNDTGWQPVTSLDDGMAATMRWYREQGWV